MLGFFPISGGSISELQGSADTTAPIMVGTLASSSITSSGFTLSWSAATDDVAVTGYEVSTNGGSGWSDIGNVLTTTRFGMPPSTVISSQVRAYDAAGNRATPLALNVTTLASGGISIIKNRGLRSRSRYQS